MYNNKKQLVTDGYWHINIEVYKIQYLQENCVLFSNIYLKSLCIFKMS